jgi:hypothetical protein
VNTNILKIDCRRIHQENCWKTLCLTHWLRHAINTMHYDYALVKTYGDIRSTLCIAHSLKHTVTYNQHYIYMHVDYPFVCYMYESYVGHYLNHIFKSFPKNHVHSHSINTKELFQICIVLL